MSADLGATWSFASTNGSLSGVTVGSNGRAFTVATAASSPTSGTIYASSFNLGAGVTPFSRWQVGGRPAWICHTFFTSRHPKSCQDITPAGLQATPFNDVSTHGGRYVIVVGNAGVIYRSANGGATWTGAVSGTSGDLNCVSMGSSLVGIAGGAYGTLIKVRVRCHPLGPPI